jgi:hypothetical protein
VWVWCGVVVAIAAAAFVLLSGAQGTPSGPSSGAPAQNAAASIHPELSGTAVRRSGEAAASPRRQPRWVSTRQRVLRGEALPCTGPEDPINFDVFSAGAAVGGVPLTATLRRCDGGALADEEPGNYLAYIYGRCSHENGADCLPPLQIRSYPACERSYADYSFEGRPLPYKELPPIGGAKVREIEFLADHRIEVYAGSSTIAISAGNWSLVELALLRLRGQPEGQRPAASASDLSRSSGEALQPPVERALEGELPCQV